MDEKELFELVNPPFPIKFGGKEYMVRKANLEKAVLYQIRIKDLVKNDDPAVDLKIAAYCLYLVLKDVDSSITEEYVLQNAPGDIDTIKCIETLGFMSPQRKLRTQMESKNL